LIADSASRKMHTRSQCLAPSCTWPGASARERGALPLSVWFTADTHFNHAGALGRFKRPFGSVADMNEAMISRWNETVGAGDEVWHLGDFALRTGGDQVSALLRRLHGRKHLVTGNNDGADTVNRPEWASVQAYAEIVLDDTRLVLCHYAFRTWNGMYKGAFNLHGHSHGQLAGMTRQVDVGVDVWDFRPIALGQIKARRRRRA
jgi:calcineurin-like phosphoesterase family protein